MEFLKLHEPQVFFEDHYDSTGSTPFVSAPSSPGPGPSNGGFFYSAPASPMHFTTTSVASMVSSTTQPSPPDNYTVPLGYEFDFSARLGSSGSGLTGSMTSADELFLNGQIRPLKLPTHLERPRVLAPLLDIKPPRGRTRSMSPLRHATFALNRDLCQKADSKNNGRISDTMSASSSDGRSSKKWVFLKGFKSSKSEERSNNNNNKEKKPWNKSNGVVQECKEKVSSKKKGGKRRVPPSPHELHYTANRAQAEEMRRKTFLPYRHGLLGCLGFSSKGYGAMNGLARAVNPVSSR
ncbi:hypothetical protein V6N13_141154 [Hibiscus sabdariffa]|uniref:Uncharacterized protein n=1 Tax=Hibiscus sabdariffa TaxID=183260 RepID=A0ABR2Q0R9_9ROSI